MHMALKKQLAIVLIALLAWYWQKYIIRGPVFTDVKDLKGKTVLITGGNAGIGKEAALQFAKMGARVVIASRNLKKSEKARDEIMKETGNRNIAAHALDLEDFVSVRSFAKKFDETEEDLDILVNNAGALGLRGIRADGYNRLSFVNHFGPFLLTNLLMDKMKTHSKKRPVRIVNLSSEAYKFVSELDYDKFKQDSSSIFSDFPIYGNTKLANIFFTSELERRIGDYDITTYAVHPGTIRSELGANFSTMHRFFLSLATPFLRSVYYGAQTILYCALDDDVIKHSGGYFYDCARRELFDYAKDAVAAKKLWEESLKITNLN